MAEEGKLDPVVGREKKSNAFRKFWAVVKKIIHYLIGEPGVGKSAIAEGLALRIIQYPYFIQQTCCNTWFSEFSRWYKIPWTIWRAHESSYEWTWENDDIILFIDEIHTIVGAGGNRFTWRFEYV
jgi:ATP-dependent Clp protease ATP-binding subunit ClpC